MGPNADEIKDDQWMGVTLKSQGEGGDILVCGHRYQQKGIGEQNFQWGYGLCYRLKNNFEYEDNYQPCKGKPVDLGHEQFGYCQAGTSGMILEDEVLLGIPGTYTWRGTVHTRNITDDYLYRDKTQYFGVYTDYDSPVGKYSYLGYSVTAGRFSGNKLSYVAGAPRSEGTGQVIFFSRKRSGEPKMNYDLILNGETFASSFGFEVLAMDLNGDKVDDLIVSAPFYFTQQSSGAVYVYINDGNGITNDTPFIRLEGAPLESRFGFSLTTLGDLNLDGYNDFAVGAPYEGKGAVYVYLGSKDGINKEPSQIIRAEDLPGLPADAFGYSLSGGMDLDDNRYNDLIVSSFCSDRVVLLRARPIIDIQTRVDTRNLQNINPTKRGCPEDVNSPETCFSFNACFKMRNEVGTETFLSLQYNISERFYNDQPTNRIKFHRSDRDKPSTVEQVVYLRPENMGTFQCSREIVYIKGGQRDVLRPVRFKLSYKIHQKDPKPVEEGEPLPDIDDYPILNQQEAVRYFEANFAKDCGSDDICDSDLRVLGEIDLEKAPEKNYYVFELGKQQYITVDLNVSNNGEPAYLPNLYVNHDKAIDLSLRESETSSYHCFPVESGLLNCNLDNPLVNMTEPLKLVFKPSGLPFKNRYMELDVWVNSTSQELNLKDNRLKYFIDVKRKAEISISGSAEPEQVSYSGEVVGESAIKVLDEIGTKVVHKYLIDNRGPWRVDDLKVQIHWPYQTENNKKEGKWLLYMTDIPVVDGDGECDVNPEYVNPLVLSSKMLTAENEVVIGDNDRLTGVTPPSVSTTTKKITKTSSTKKVVTSSVKKTYTKKTSSKSSQSSSNSFIDEEDEGDEMEGSGSYGRGSSRSNSRVSRKVYTSDPTNKENHRKTNAYDYNTDEYENYDNFFYGNDLKEKKSGTSDTTTTTREGSSVGNFDMESSFHDIEQNALSSVADIKTVRDGDEIYLNGYDRNGNLVWSSRRRVLKSLHTSSGSPHKHYESRTEYSKTYSSHDNNKASTSERDRDLDIETRYKLRQQEIDNERILGQNLGLISEFRIVAEGGNSWVNGYDDHGRVIWTSRPRNVNYVRKEYSVRKTSRTQDGDKVDKTWESWGTSEHTKDGKTIRNVTYSSSGHGDEPSQEHRESHSRIFHNHRNEGGDSPTESFTRNENYEDDSTHSLNRHNHFNRRYPERQNSTTTTHYSRSRWGKSGGFRKERIEPQISDTQENTRTDAHYDSHNEHYTSSDPDYVQNDDGTLHGHTYSRVVVDPKSGDAKVFSQKIFSRKTGEHWEEVHGPYKDEEWTNDFHYDDGESLIRTKREREYIIKPEGY
ncbi:Integrin alpha-PS1 [Armadillidium nasatum]|uniref:Integrin alpha-PS1 n=1 Tax=Armadillidium nasatum TaxID=96803 RepID=A0A5N5SJJ0_9CRUS|nr:Integrin alpha-PS1 [Armadillidium nasatum]